MCQKYVCDINCSKKMQEAVLLSWSLFSQKEHHIAFYFIFY